MRCHQVTAQTTRDTRQRIFEVVLLSVTLAQYQPSTGSMTPVAAEAADHLMAITFLS